MRRGLTCFAFLTDSSTEAASGKEDLFPAAVRTPEHQEQLLAFRTEVQQHIVSYFTTIEDLANKVMSAITRYLLAEQWRHWLTDTPSPRFLPPPVAGFVGRSSELVTLTQTLLAGQDTGLTALVSGMGGVGKSALAAEAIHRLAQDPTAFPAGIAWIRCDGRPGPDGLVRVYDELLSSWKRPVAAEELAQATTPDAGLALREQQLQRLFPPTLSQLPAFPVSPPPGSSFDVTRAPGHDPHHPVPVALVLLDNVELDFPLSRALQTLAAAQMTVLVTARHRPASGRLYVMTLDVLTPEAARDLFSERYRAKGGTWQDDRDQEAVAAITMQLGSLPLAIELAAARAALTHTSVTGLLADLTEARRLGYLEDPLNATQPEGSVRYTLGQSLQILTTSDRQHFAALGLLTGADWPRSAWSRLDPTAPTTDGPTRSAAATLDRLSRSRWWPWKSCRNPLLSLAHRPGLRGPTSIHCLGIWPTKNGRR